MSTEVTTGTPVAQADEAVNAQLAQRVADTFAAAGRALNLPNDVLIETVTTAISEANAPGATLVRQWKPPTHPEEFCTPSWCLVTTRINEHGRAVHNVGYHRTSVQTLESAYGDILQVGVAMPHDVCGPDVNEPVVHVRATDVDEDIDDEPWHTTLTEDEAAQLGDMLLRKAASLRAIRERREREEARQAAEASVAELLPQLAKQTPVASVSATGPDVAVRS